MPSFSAPASHTSSLLMLLAPSANHVYASQTAQLAIAELALTTGYSAKPVRIAGVDYLSFDAEDPDLAALSRQSAALGLFENISESSDEFLLRPHELPHTRLLDDDLVTIPKYRGKTNELFTQLLLNVTISQVQTNAHIKNPHAQLDILDPMAGRGTTLCTSWINGHNGYGVELDTKSFDQFAGFLKTYLRRKRLKHTATTAPVKRNGRAIGQRLDATVRPAEKTSGYAGIDDAPALTMTFFTGDTRDSAALFGKKRFDAIITDAPYGIVHGATSTQRGSRDRSPAELLTEAIPVWASQLKTGGALGISWNTYGLSREKLAEIYKQAGLDARNDDGRNQNIWQSFSHRVDSSIQRDLMVGVKA